MFKRILIANRGEIAVRIIRACQELDIETVAVYSEADANALHVQLADLSYPIGPSDASESYLNMEAILRAARETGADAIHPGYGFLSENADFADMVTKAGLTWIGPLAVTIRQVGDKDVARAAMEPSGIPMAKGSEPLTDYEMAMESAKEVGYPVILKPVSGGGGKGMFVAHNAKELTDILNVVDLEKTKFYFEHYIERSRHIEVQIVADNYGSIIHLGGSVNAPCKGAIRSFWRNPLPSPSPMPCVKKWGSWPSRQPRASTTPTSARWNSCWICPTTNSTLWKSTHASRWSTASRKLLPALTWCAPK